ncbi:AAA family ATPase [Halomonas sp. TBZ9]|uniref:AAA family ATPase n=1 Tax=Vreelandella azerica TaxID=2732867 RepID=A0A7Y3X987_9GAMM|nr:ATP-binding protein [Halomonas azerica]NOG31422.1 AAA family ATPase [Halomonas azerica]
MQLISLEVSEFQQFRTGFALNGLTPGINLLTGPNESGKSTLVRAIRAAFFERHKSSTLSDLQPWGDSSAAPQVSLAFEWQGQHWKLDKRFLQRKRCDLKVGDTHYSGDEAEEHLAQLLGYATPARGASKAEHWGIPGLLWVEQGAGQHIRDPANHAGEHLQSALSQHLGDALGEVVSSGGDQLIQQVEQQRAKLLTQTGKPTGDLRDTREACNTLADELAEQETQVARYRDQVDHLGQLQAKQCEVEAQRPWEAQRDKAKAAETQLVAVEKLREQQAQAQKTLDEFQHHQQLNHQQLEDFAAQASQLEERQKDKQKAEQQLAQCKAHAAPIEQQREAASQRYDDARQILTAARHKAHRQRLQQQLKSAEDKVRRLAETLAKARELQQQRQKLSAQHQHQAVDIDALERLRQLELQLGQLKAKQEMLATRLAYRLEPGQQLMIDQTSVAGEGEKLLLSATDVAIPGVGTLTIQPGGTDVADLLRQQQNLEADREALLQQLQVTNLSSAEQQASKARELAHKVEQTALRLGDLAPNGVDTLAGEHQLAEQERSTLAASLAALPAHQDDAALPTEELASRQLETTQAQLEEAEQARSHHHQTLTLAQQALTNAEREWQRLKAAIQAPDRQEREQSARRRLIELKAEVEQLQADMNTRQRDIDAANPTMLAQDIKRFSDSADAMEFEARERASEIERLKTRLETLGAQGLEEQRDALRQQLESQQRRRLQLEKEPRRWSFCCHCLNASVRP